MMSPDSNEAFASVPVRQKATAAMRSKANALEREAKDWQRLADVLDAIEAHAATLSKDGSEGGPHIGVGSQAEYFLWSLAMRS